MGADMINSPPHYKGRHGLEVIEIVENFDLGFCLGNVVKYVCRAGRKHADLVQDLKKARWNLDREISRLESEPK